MKPYEINEIYEESARASYLNSFLSFISYHFPKRRRPV
jgi:hypothetical protein